MDYNFVPSPIKFDYDMSYSALANNSGRMQYYREYRDGNRLRIGRNEFVNAFNNKPVVAVQPIPSSAQVFQLQFFIKE
ncbi:MAG: hypothetical protein ABFS32_14920 [Bacteroidota bacterium]